MSADYRVTFVCLGNICRSPMGEAVLRQRLTTSPLANRVIVDSAGTAGYHIGEDAHPDTISVLATSGYPLDHSAKQITEHWVGDVNLAVVMDTSNYANVQRLIEKSRVDTELRMLRSFDPALSNIAEPDSALDVPDPYDKTFDEFVSVLAMVERSVDGLVKHLESTL